MKHIARIGRVRKAVLAALPALLLAGFLFHAAPAEADEQQRIETRIKAAFIHHFCGYISWPEGAFEQPDSPLVLGVMGSEAMADALRNVTDDRLAHGRRMIIRQLDPGDSLEELHLLFIADSVAPQVREQVAATADESVLVVTESPGALESGSAINFVVEDDRVRFDIAPAATRRARLQVSAQLFTVARVIRQEPAR